MKTKQDENINLIRDELLQDLGPGALLFPPGGRLQGLITELIGEIKSFLKSGCNRSGGASQATIVEKASLEKTGSEKMGGSTSEKMGGSQEDPASYLD